MSDSAALRPFLNNRDFNRLSQLIDNELGIKMPESKKVMLESRLQKRLKILGLDDYSSYCNYIFSEEGKQTEWVQFFNVVTTNKTDFFRENSHFEYLRDVLLPSYYSQGGRDMKIWSCACSSGEEPYTIAIVLEQFRAKHPDFRYSILATDISTKVLGEAEEAIYNEQDVSIIPLEVKRASFLRGKNENSGFYRVKDPIRKNVSFKRFNLMDSDYKTIGGPFEIIFCRNVLIYFDRDRQTDIIKKLNSRLVYNGLLFLGHSESMAGMSVQLKAVSTAIYQRNGV